MYAIRNMVDLSAVAVAIGVRRDWHEPDEQEVRARVVGDHLDNAMGPSADPDRNCGELNVILTKDGRDFAVVNLATLFAWANLANQ